jgi:hypothetical protein
MNIFINEDNKYNVNFERSTIAIFLFLLIISGNYLGTLFPCRVQVALQENIFLRHFLGFFTLLFFVVLTLPNKPEFKMILTIATRVYIFFILLSKTPVYIWLVVFALASITYLLEIYKDDKNKELVEDENSNILNDNKMLNDKNIVYIQKTISIIGIILTISGFLIYMGEKKYEYKNKFSYITFLLGNSSCVNKTGNKNIMNSLKHIFD